MSFDLKNSNTHFHPEETQPQRENTADENQEYIENSSRSKTGKILFQWNAPEFEVYEKSARWYTIAGLFILAMVAYALYTNGPIMAITFILIGIVGYIYLQKDPRVITFSITTKGVIADKEMYLYENINSFWIFYDPPHTKTISLHTNASMLPFVHIPFRDEDPVKLRELLIKNVPEIKQDPGLIDAIERFLHI
ncbi:MAG: hypothetical protein ACD_15C00238G0001 [uncultured bacterium]|nr:MAG: hypothetical protein ACD_15C00238G0001 [uncultured bacterium]